MGSFTGQLSSTCCNSPLPGPAPAPPTEACTMVPLCVRMVLTRASMSIIAFSPSTFTWCTRWSRAMKVPVRPTPALEGEGRRDRLLHPTPLVHAITQQRDTQLLQRSSKRRDPGNVGGRLALSTHALTETHVPAVDDGGGVCVT